MKLGMINISFIAPFRLLYMLTLNLNVNLNMTYESQMRGLLVSNPKFWMSDSLREQGLSYIGGNFYKHTTAAKAPTVDTT